MPHTTTSCDTCEVKKWDDARGVAMVNLSLVWLHAGREEVKKWYKGRPREIWDLYNGRWNGNYGKDKYRVL